MTMSEVQSDDATQAKPGEGLSLSKEVRAVLNEVLKRDEGRHDTYAYGYRDALRDVLNGRFWS